MKARESSDFFNLLSDQSIKLNQKVALLKTINKKQFKALQEIFFNILDGQFENQIKLQGHNLKLIRRLIKSKNTNILRKKEYLFILPIIRKAWNIILNTWEQYCNELQQKHEQQQSVKEKDVVSE